MVGFGPVDNRIHTAGVSRQMVGDTQETGETKNFFDKVGTILKQIVFGRFGAKAGRHSALGWTFKLGLPSAFGKKVVTGKAEAPVHTHTFKELTREKAREFTASANGGLLAAGGDPGKIGLDEPETSFGRLLTPHDPIRKEMNKKLDKISKELLDSMTVGERKLYNDIKSICSDKAYISPNGVIVDPKSGLRAAITKDPGNPEKYIVSFAGTGALEEGDPPKMALIQNFANVTQYLGFVPHLYNQAKDLVAAVTDMCGRENVSTAGHSLGGGMAQYAALHNGVKGKCFNGSPLGFALQKSLGDKINNAGKLIEHVSMRGDWLSHSGAPLPIGIPKGEFSEISGPDTRPRRMSKLADFLGIRTRGNFGEKYYLNFSKKRYAQQIENMAKEEKVDLTDESTKEKLANIVERRAQAGTTSRHCNILPEIIFFAKAH